MLPRSLLGLIWDCVPWSPETGVCIYLRRASRYVFLVTAWVTPMGVSNSAAIMSADV